MSVPCTPHKSQIYIYKIYKRSVTYWPQKMALDCIPQKIRRCNTDKKVSYFF